MTKEYYQRQILQPIPGYIPVYIKTERPIFRKAERVPKRKQNSDTDEISKRIEESTVLKEIRKA